ILTLSLHTKGEEIYYDFYNKNKKRDKKIANLFAHNLKYKIVSTEKNSAGGYKDWCIEKLGITALTIECGSDKLSHPLSRNIEVLPLLENKFKDLFRLINKSVVIINGNK
ncbi:MAG: hypothetical protein RR334_00170, partial [Clostridia bacterium]